MNPELKSKWVAALRSGKYEQGRNYLRVGNAYCCLGVLCSISGVVDKTPNDDTGYFDSQETNLGSSMLLRFALSPAQESTLISMNDEQGKSFSEIADYIEANL